jgi:predicted Zn-dependent peptidase
MSIQAQVDRTKAPAPGPAPKINLGTPQEFTLKNGLTVLVVENHKLPRVSMTLSIDNGPSFEGETIGSSSLLSSMLGTGMEGMTKDEFNETVDYHGARVNFWSSGARMSSLSKYYPKIMGLMANAMIKPIFVEKEFKAEKDKYITGLKSNEKSADAINSNVQGALAFGKNHPYGEFETLATAEKLTLKNVQDYYNSFYRPNNAYLVIVGDVDFKTIKKQVKKAFKSWKKAASIPVAKMPEVKNVEEIEIDFVNLPDAVQSKVFTLSTTHLTMNDKDYFPVLIANKIFGGDFNSYLNMNLREAHAYTYGARSSVRPDKYISKFSAGASVRNEVTDSTVVQILKELKHIRTEKVAADVLSTVKASYTGKFVMGVQKPNTVAGYALNIKKKNLPADFYEKYLANINAVTADDVMRVAKKYFNYDNTRILVIGKAIEVLPNLEKLPYAINYFDKEGNPTDKPEMKKEVPAGVTLETVLDKYFEAIGGKDKIAQIKTKRIIAEITVKSPQGEMTMDIETLEMAPNKSKTIVKVMGMEMISVFDGEKGYKPMGPGQKKDMDAEAVAAAKKESKPFEEFAFVANGAKLDGIENIDGKDMYVVILEDATSVYYDVVTGLKNRKLKSEKGPGGKMVNATVIYDDYRAVDGIKVPFIMNTTQSMGNKSQEMPAVVKSIEFNKGIAATDFK